MFERRGSKIKMNDILELWLVRHGETTWNSAGRMAGWSDVPLTKQGEAQAANLRPRLEGTSFSEVWSSNLIRAVQTARLAYGEPAQDERLKEINFGDLEGAAWATMDPKHKAALTDFGTFRAPNGETIKDAETRLLKFISTLSKGRHLVFTHGGIIRILTKSLGLDHFVANGSVVVVDWTNQKIIQAPEP